MTRAGLPVIVIIKSLAVAIAANLSLLTYGYAAELVISCPEDVAVKSLEVESPASWRALTKPNKLRVVSAGFSDGPPSNMVHLKPRETRKTRAGDVVAWSFEGEYKDGKWLSCDYEERLVHLVKELPAEISHCEVEYVKKNGLNQSVGPIRCK